MTTVLAPTKQAEQKVILHDVSWETYERLLADFVDSHAAHFAYDNGTMEIMVLSFEHERLTHTLTMLVELLADALEIDTEGTGSTTFRRADLAKGFEPDASFYFQHAALIRAQEQIDLNTDPAPELIIEVDITSPSLDKFPIFAALGVTEVWRHDGAQVAIHCLVAGAYNDASESALLPGVTAALINQLLAASRMMKRGDWVRLVRASVQSPPGGEQAGG